MASKCYKLFWETNYGLNEDQSLTCSPPLPVNKIENNLILTIFNQYSFVRRLRVYSDIHPDLIWSNGSDSKPLKFTKIDHNTWETSPENIKLKDTYYYQNFIFLLAGITIISLLLTWLSYELWWHFTTSILTATISTALIIKSILSFILFYPGIINFYDTKSIVWDLGVGHFHLNHMITFEYVLRALLQVYRDYQIVSLMYAVFYANVLFYISRFLIKYKINFYFYTIIVFFISLNSVSWVYTSFIERSALSALIFSVFLIKVIKFYNCQRPSLIMPISLSLLGSLCIAAKMEYLLPVTFCYLVLISLKRSKTILCTMFMISVIASTYGLNRALTTYYETEDSPHKIAKTISYHHILKQLYQTCKLPKEFILELEKNIPISKLKNNIFDCTQIKNEYNYYEISTRFYRDNLTKLEQNVFLAITNYPYVFIESRLDFTKYLSDRHHIWFESEDPSQQQKRELKDLNLYSENNPRSFKTLLIKFQSRYYLLWLHLLIIAVFSIVGLGSNVSIIAIALLLHTLTVLILSPTPFPGYLYDLYLLALVIPGLASADYKNTLIFRYFSK